MYKLISRFFSPFFYSESFFPSFRTAHGRRPAGISYDIHARNAKKKRGGGGEGAKERRCCAANSYSSSFLPALAQVYVICVAPNLLRADRELRTKRPLESSAGRDIGGFIWLY